MVLPRPALAVSLSLFALPCLAPGGALATASGACIAWSPQDRLETEHFTLHFDREGPNAVSTSDQGRTISRSDGVIIGYAAAGNGVPDYVEEAAIGLEYAWDTYRVAGLRLPEHQPVFIKDGLGAYGLYLPECGDIYLEPDLVGVTRTAAHELAHAVQYEYWDLSDFAEIPGPQQAFYKEASADAMMIQVMRPAPYVSWFDSPDARFILEAGTGAAFFWLYYGERFGGAVPGQDVLPGLVGMARYLELVAEPSLDLRDALELLPVEQDLMLDDVMESLAVANLLEDLLSPFDPAEHPELAPFEYVFSHVRGFYNALAPVTVGAPSFGLTGVGRGRMRSVSLEGQVQHLWNADYFEIDRSLFASGAVVSAELYTSGARGSASVVAVSVSTGEAEILQSLRLEDGDAAAMVLPITPDLRLFIVAQSGTADGPWPYRLELTLGARSR